VKAAEKQTENKNALCRRTIVNASDRKLSRSYFMLTKNQTGLEDRLLKERAGKESQQGNSYKKTLPTWGKREWQRKKRKRSCAGKIDLRIVRTKGTHTGGRKKEKAGERFLYAGEEKNFYQV